MKVDLEEARKVIAAQRKKEESLKTEERRLASLNASSMSSQGGAGGEGKEAKVAKEVDRCKRHIQEWNLTIAAHQPKVLCMERGLLHLELNRLRAERIHRIRTMFSQYVD